MLVVQHLNLKLQIDNSIQRTILQNINLNIQNNEIVCLAGSNGAGKSSLLKVINGSIKQTSGHIYLDGKNIHSQSRRIIAQHISYIDQDPLIGTCAAFTVAENLAIAAKRGQKCHFMNILSVKRRNYFRSYLASFQLGLEEYFDRPVANLSGGQRQMLSIIMAILQPTTLLLLDEPTAALDAKNADYLIKFIKQTAKQYNLSLLMVTHDFHHALRISDRIIIMNTGEIRQILQKKRYAAFICKQSRKFSYTIIQNNLRDINNGLYLRCMASTQL